MSSDRPDGPIDPALRHAIWRSAVGIGLYAGALGVSFGAVSGASGLDIWQTMVLSLVMFTGGSQFAFVGASALGSAWAAMSVALLLSVRNSFYGVRLARTLQVRGWRRPLVAHLIIDETTAMAVAQRGPAAQRQAFYATGFVLFALWQTGSLCGVLIGRGIESHAFGLDVAAPAAFLALLWPALATWRARIVAVTAGLVAFALIPVVPAGIPIIATALVALAAGVVQDSDKAPAGEQDRGPDRPANGADELNPDPDGARDPASHLGDAP